MSDATTRELTVPAGAARARVDRVVADLSGLSRSYVQKLISNGGLTQNGVALHANDVIEPGAQLRLVVPAAVPLELAAEPMDIPTVYEDDDLLIVDKPAGLV